MDEVVAHATVEHDEEDMPNMAAPKDYTDSIKAEASIKDKQE